MRSVSDLIQKIRHKKELQRIDWRIIKRLVTSLYYNNKMKKTHIATKCNLGYDKCRLYLDWMEMMDLIKRETDENEYEVIILTEKGKSLHNSKFNDTSKFKWNNRI
jgi:predicted transcriptional regulator